MSIPSLDLDADTAYVIGQSVISYYADKFHGRCTSTGQVFLQHKKSAATFNPKKIPLGSLVELSYIDPRTGKVRTVSDILVNDRGGHIRNDRVLDVSRQVFRELGVPTRSGVAKVTVRVVGRKKIIPNCHKH